MIPNEFTGRTFLIQCGSQQGTAFTYDRGGRQYIVTARHLISELSARTPFLLSHAGKWLEVPATVVGVGGGEVDIAVLASKGWATRTNGEVFQNNANIVYGQDVYFLGFPFGMFSDVGEFTSRFPLPFVKKAIMSAMSLGSNEAMYLDGINNPGFSGGPVIGKLGAIGPLAIMAVISGYNAADAKVLHKANDTGLIVRENTGLIRAFHIGSAHALIDANPIGEPL
jgi:hypothetical protein